jgi:hypothetical protein
MTSARRKIKAVFIAAGMDVEDKLVCFRLVDLLDPPADKRLLQFTYDRAGHKSIEIH